MTCNIVYSKIEFRLNRYYGALRVLHISLMNSWLVGWLGFTALQHDIGYIAPVSVVNVKMSARVG